MTPLQHAAVAGSAEVISALLAAGGKANLFDDQRRMPLHWTAGHGFVDATRVLLEEGKASPDVVDLMGWTPLHRCCQEKMPENALGPKKKPAAEGAAGSYVQRNI